MQPLMSYRRQLRAGSMGEGEGGVVGGRGPRLTRSLAAVDRHYLQISPGRVAARINRLTVYGKWRASEQATGKPGYPYVTRSL